MSLRVRLLAVIVLAAITLGIALTTVLRLLSNSDAARIESVTASLDAANDALTDEFAGLHTPSLRATDPALLADRSRAVVAALPDTHLGYCTTDGALVGMSATGSHGELGAHPLPPDQRDAVVLACRSGTSPIVVRHAHDVVLVAVKPLAPDGAAFTLRRVEIQEGIDIVWKVHVLALSLATALLVAVTLTAVVGLRRGTQQVEAVVRDLGRDLRAPVATPAAAEFAALTRALGAMARDLAEAQDRERALAGDLAHRERLAGLGRVVAGVAHEIRNPLAGIKLKLDVMARAPETTTLAQGEIRECLDEVARLDRVVQSLLTVARRSRAEPERIDVGATIDDRSRAAERALGSGRIVRTGDAEAWLDRDGFVRVIDNLLRNALEASPGAAAVTVDVARVGGALEICVVDQGEGVAKTEALFEPFFTTKPGGTGLGLWLSRALVEAAGGTLTYERRDGTTRFRVHVPQAEAP